MPTYTTNYSLKKPIVNSATDEDLWGGYLNDSADLIDTALKNIADGTGLTDNAVTLAKMAHGTAGKYLGFNGSGVPSELTPADAVSYANNGYGTNRYNFGFGFSLFGTDVFPANMLSIHPFIVGSATTFTRIGINVLYADTGSARMGVYNVENGLPTTLILDAGTVNTGTAGEKEITISLSLNAGVYAVAYVQSSNATITTIQGGVNSVTGAIFSHILGKNNPTDTFQDWGWSDAFTFGALPNPCGHTFSDVIQSQNELPAVWLRKV